MVNARSLTYSQVVEAMRDLCGSFGNIKTLSYNNMLMYVLPEAAKRALEDEPEMFSAKESINAIMHRGFMELSNISGYEYPDYRATEKCVSDFIRSKRNVSEFTEEEVAYLCDIFYINSVSVAVESAARKIIREKYPEMLKKSN